ncbi:hypothetical protein [Nocardioides sp. Soil805]|uniref:hypothetical protein n=1 Tax=Nocardioides sp. Soil805 TaxID=1736416 RepID=UPI0012E3DF8F|nr:hypothetical protein [Nocardioides sp. Soil805]
MALLEELTRVHRESRGHGALTDRELMARVPAYGTGAHAERTLRNDKRALRDRGLVVTNVPLEREQYLKGIKRAPLLEKAPEWHLTLEEHNALRAVREDLRRRSVPVGPTETKAPSRRGNRVDEALRIVRLLEEHEDLVEVEVVAACFGVGVQQARRWLSELADGFDPVGLEYGRDADDVAAQDITGARLRRTSADWQQPLAGTGSDLLGLFPYSRTEVEERLALLEEYGDAVERGQVAQPVSRAVLDRVAWKLTAWRDHLTAAT